MEHRLEHIINDSIFNLLDATVFYVPEVLVDTFSPNEKEQWAPHINQLMLVENGSFEFAYEGDDMDIKVLRKFKFLDEGLYMLYNLKDQLGESGFQYAVEKYGELVELFHFITEWLNDNCQNDIDHLKENEKKAFLMQYELHLKHKKDFEKRFALPKIDIERESPIVESVKKSLSGFMPVSNEELATENDQAQQNLIGNKKPPTKREHLQQLRQDTQQKAEKYLLTTVFGLKLKE